MTQNGTLGTYTVNSITYNKVVQNNINIGGTITETRTCSIANVGSATPNVNTAHPTLSGYVVTSTNQDPLPSGLVKVSIVYTAQYEGTPATTVVEQTSNATISIEEHPSFSAWVADWDEDNQRFKSTSSKAGISEYVVGSTTVTVTEYFDSKPSSRHADIGKLETPSGTEYGTKDNWLIIGSTRQQVNSFWQRVTTYEYSAKPYDSDIYEDA